MLPQIWSSPDICIPLYNTCKMGDCGLPYIPSLRVPYNSTTRADAHRREWATYFLLASSTAAAPGGAAWRRGGR